MEPKRGQLISCDIARTKVVSQCGPVGVGKRYDTRCSSINYLVDSSLVPAIGSSQSVEHRVVENILRAID